MAFKFEKLEVWQLALDYLDSIYELAEQLPSSEDFNLKSQMKRAATSVALNIAEGSTGQTDIEQARFLGYAIRSVMETVACQHIINRRKLAVDITSLREAYREAEKLTAKLQALRKAITPKEHWVREDSEAYEVGDDDRPMTTDQRRPTTNDRQSSN